MFAAKSTLLAAIFAVSAQVVTANVPPGCLIAAINTESTPADTSLLCGADSAKVIAQIHTLCKSSAATDAAMSQYRDTCKSAGKTISSTAESSSSSKTGSATASATGSDSGSASTTTTGSSSGATTTAPYPIVFTSTYYDTVCSCTKTTSVSTSGIAGSTGFATGTGAPFPTGTGSSSGTGSGSGSGSSATGSPIAPVVTPGSGNAPFTGAASKTVGSFAAAALAVLGLALAM
ncbi:MAG: hypothetical protein Q9220_004031 [cf. Caloplaca sp. 1 TL-2023]